MAKFKTGDVVRLNSDTDNCIHMTVFGYAAKEGSMQALAGKDLGYDLTKMVICDWRDVNGKNYQVKYHEDELTLISEK